MNRERNFGCRCSLKYLSRQHFNVLQADLV